MELDDDGLKEWNLKTHNWKSRPSGDLVALCSALVWLEVDGGRYGPDRGMMEKMLKWVQRREPTRKRYGIG